MYYFIYDKNIPFTVSKGVESVLSFDHGTKVSVLARLLRTETSAAAHPEAFNF